MTTATGRLKTARALSAGNPIQSCRVPCIARTRYRSGFAESRMKVMA